MICRDRGSFGAEVMSGFEGRRRLLLRVRPHGAAEANIMALAHDDALSIAEALHAAATVADEALASQTQQG